MCVRPDREGIDDLAKDRRTPGRWSRRPKAFWPVARARGLIPYLGMKESSEVRHVA